MLERVHFVVMYVGSAAVVALLAACLNSPRIDSFTCHTSGANGTQRCELTALAAGGSEAAQPVQTPSDTPAP